MAMHRRSVIAVSLLSTLAGSTAAFADSAGSKQVATPPGTPPTPRTVEMRIRLTINGKVAIATVDNTVAGQDFASLLPLHLTLEDYNATEKISDLPRRLSVTNAPSGHAPSVGDIAYYAPWGNLAIFYRDFRYSPGLIRLGRIESGIDALRQKAPPQNNDRND